MEESFLHFLWKYQHFNSRELTTISGQEITVFHPGYLNTNAGPDFINAKVKIGNITWTGSVEIHVNAKDWHRHGHQEDGAYDNVILHVVWKNDAVIHRQNKSEIPAMEMKGIVDHRMIEKYQRLMALAGADILCNAFLENTKPITIYSMMDKVLAERMQEKAENIFREIALTGNDWEEIAWWMLCKNFGFKTNTSPFHDLGKSLPLKILKKEVQNPKTVEALLFGQAGFLEDKSDDAYHAELSAEYAFKSMKYSLERRVDRHQWKFLRLRPANFPTVRIAQLAALVVRHSNLFSLFMDFEGFSTLKKQLAVTQSEYWLRHYNFGTVTENEIGRLGAGSIENILINTVAPLLFAYGVHKGREELKEKSFELLAAIRPEANSITKKWKHTGLEIKSAFDSQASIELFNQYCLKKRCLHCAIGTEIISGA